MEKFIPSEKLSKKRQRAQNAARRGRWYGLNPVTRKSENSRAYNRQKARKWRFHDRAFYYAQRGGFHLLFCAWAMCSLRSATHFRSAPCRGALLQFPQGSGEARCPWDCGLHTSAVGKVPRRAHARRDVKPVRVHDAAGRQWYPALPLR